MKAHWKVKFMRRGSEPPMPFGKTDVIVAAESRNDAIEIVRATGWISDTHPKVSASKTDKPVDYYFQYTEAPSEPEV